MAADDYKDLLESLLNHKEHCFKLAAEKLQHIEEALEQCEKVEKQSYDEIRLNSRNIIVKVQQIEESFIQALNMASSQQKNSLLKQKLELQSTLEELSKIAEDSSVTLSCTPERVHQEVALTFLPKTVSCLKHFVKEEEDFYPVHFVNLDLLNSLNRNKFGYLEYGMIDFSAFQLFDMQRANETTFMVLVPQDYDVKKIMKYFSWSFEKDDKNIKADGRIFDKDFILKISGDPGIYSLSFFIYSQHISGSPATFEIKEPPHLAGRVAEKKDTFMDEDDDPKHFVDQNSNLVSPPKPKMEASLCLAVAQSSPLSSPCKQRPELIPDRKFVSRSLGMVRIPLRRPHVQNGKETEIAKCVRKTKAFLPTSLRIQNSASPNENPVIKKNLWSPDSESSNSKLAVEEFQNTHQLAKPGTATMVLDRVLLKEEKLTDFEENVIEVKYEAQANGHTDPSLQGGLLNELMSIKLDNSALAVKKNLFPAFDSVKANPSEIPAVVSRSILRFNPLAHTEMVFKGADSVCLEKPIGVAQSHGGQIVIADTCNNRMVMLSPEGRFFKSFNGSSSTILCRPSAVVVLPDGKIAVRDDRRIVTFSPEGRLLATLGAGCFQKPFGLTCDTDGTLITLDTGHDPARIVCIDPLNGKIVKSLPIALPILPHLFKMSKLRFICFRKPSDLLVVDLGLNYIYMYNLDNGQIMNKIGGFGKAEGQFNDPSGIACDADGYILVGDSRNHRIQIFCPSGNFASVLEVDRPLKRPSGLCLTPDGKLLVCNYWENAVVKYDLRLTDPCVPN